jgi:hypothetical protein
VPERFEHGGKQIRELKEIPFSVMVQFGNKAENNFLSKENL